MCWGDARRIITLLKHTVATGMTLTILSRLDRQLTGSIPLQDAGQVSCGFPSPAADHALAELSLDELVGLSPTSSLFLMTAWGDSMQGCGIYDGDVLVVDKAREAKPNDIVVAVVGSEFVAKRLGQLDDGKRALISANPRYAPLIIDEDEGITVWGVCVWNLHRLA